MTLHRLTSVIMVTEHTGEVLEGAIRSVLDQTAEVELILVNNGNPPEVEAQLVERFKDDPAVRLMTGHGAIGPARGANLGARVARGDYLLFLSPCATLKPNAIEKLCLVAEKVKSPFMLGLPLVSPSGKEWPSSRKAALTPVTAIAQKTGLCRYKPRYRRFLTGDLFPKSVTPVGALSAACLFIPRKDFVDMHGFAEFYQVAAHDEDLCRRFAHDGGAVLFVPGPAVTLAPSPRPVDPVAYAKQKAKDFIRYFHENDSDSYFQPLLWGLYAFMTARAALSPYIPVKDIDV